MATRAAEKSTTHVGWTLGAGVDYRITPNWIARAEYRYSDFGSWKNNYFPNTNTDEIYARTELTSNRVTVGISYLFGAQTSPVVAKY